jgi:hypothetical protein
MAKSEEGDPVLGQGHIQERGKHSFLIKKPPKTPDVRKLVHERYKIKRTQRSLFLCSESMEIERTAKELFFRRNSYDIQSSHGKLLLEALNLPP